ncbi:hypothetical protein TURU_096542 [Turdus rufiventris]|nr:hypothetical protein TURU_096542 [Turdus rufiventris]
MFSSQVFDGSSFWKQAGAVYDLDGISLILDNCSIDDNNPCILYKIIEFVSQWAIYAIRNLTEDNEQNQALIAQMEQKGLADTSTLERMGLEIQQRDDKLILRLKPFSLVLSMFIQFLSMQVQDDNILTKEVEASLADQGTVAWEK